MRCSHEQYTRLADDVARIAIQSCLVCAEIWNYTPILKLLSIAEADRGRNLGLYRVVEALKGIDYEGRPLAVACDHDLGCGALRDSLVDQIDIYSRVVGI